MPLEIPRPLAEALNEALMDEYRARAIYRKVLGAFGPIRPFINIVEAETTHVGELLPLFRRYGLPVPEDDWAERVEAPASLRDACRQAVQAEIANAAMYDRLLAAARGFPEVEAVFHRLQAASRDRHLPAFQRCVERAEGGEGRGGGPGGGGRQGRGRPGGGGGMGRGRGRNRNRG